MAGIFLLYNMVSNCSILVNSFSKQHFYVQQKLMSPQKYFISIKLLSILQNVNRSTKLVSAREFSCHGYFPYFYQAIKQKQTKRSEW